MDKRLLHWHCRSRRTLTTVHLVHQQQQQRQQWTRQGCRLWFPKQVRQLRQLQVLLQGPLTRQLRKEAAAAALPAAVVVVAAHTQVLRDKATTVMTTIPMSMSVLMMLTRRGTTMATMMVMRMVMRMVRMRMRTKVQLHARWGLPLDFRLSLRSRERRNGSWAVSVALHVLSRAARRVFLAVEVAAARLEGKPTAEQALLARADRRVRLPVCLRHQHQHPHAL